MEQFGHLFLFSPKNGCKKTFTCANLHLRHAKKKNLPTYLAIGLGQGMIDFFGALSQGVKLGSHLVKNAILLLFLLPQHLFGVRRVHLFY
jgi:hypothetical protein